MKALLSTFAIIIIAAIAIVAISKEDEPYIRILHNEEYNGASFEIRNVTPPYCYDDAVIQILRNDSIIFNCLGYDSLVSVQKEKQGLVIIMSNTLHKTKTDTIIANLNSEAWH